MEKIFIDTSALVALFVKNDENHKKADSIFNRIKNDKIPICTSDYIIDETITMILKRGNKDLSITVGDVLMSSQICTLIHVNPNYFKSVWDLYKKYKDKPFSFTDTTSFAIMKALNINRAFAFDDDFEKAGFEVIT